MIEGNANPIIISQIAVITLVLLYNVIVESDAFSHEWIWRQARYIARIKETGRGRERGREGGESKREGGLRGRESERSDGGGREGGREGGRGVSGQEHYRDVEHPQQWSLLYIPDLFICIVLEHDDHNQRH